MAKSYSLCSSMRTTAPDRRVDGSWSKTLVGCVCQRFDVSERRSPVPEAELPKLDVLFGNDRLASLIGVGSSSLRRYLAKDREVPDDVAGRLHLVAQVVGNLAGSYNDRGIRRWFERPRVQLDGQSPEDILKGQWGTDDPTVTCVASLAADLVS